MHVLTKDNISQFKVFGIDDVKSFFTFLIDVLKVNFHPEDPFDSYINTTTGEDTFNIYECALYDSLMQDCFTVCELNNVDIYSLIP